MRQHNLFKIRHGFRSSEPHCKRYCVQPVSLRALLSLALEIDTMDGQFSRTGMEVLW
jgi:hypothetical protein